MTRDEAIREACSIVAMAYRSIGDYSQPSDGFCSGCPPQEHPDWNYQNAGQALQYVRTAVVRALAEDGHTVALECRESQPACSVCGISVTTRGELCPSCWLGEVASGNEDVS